MKDCKKQFNSSLEDIRMSPIVTISEEAKVRGADLLFQRGELNFKTPKYIKDAILEAMDKDLTKYPVSGGNPFFKDAIISWAKSEYAVDLEPNNIVATCGGQEGLELSFKLFKRGAGFSPIWSCALENFIPYTGVDFTQITLRRDFSIEYNKLEDVIKNCDFFYLNNPQNPTGKVFSKEELEKVSNICKKHGCFVLSDEAYCDIIFDGKKHTSMMEINENHIISVFTLSKSFAMTGFRSGYVVTKNKRVAELIKLGNYTQTAGISTPIQWASAAALNNKQERLSHIKSMVGELQIRRDALYTGLKSIQGIGISQKPEGAFYVFPDFSALGGGYEVYEKLMNKGVATVYGSCFGKHFENNIRFSFSATSLENIKDIVIRMKSL